MGLSVEASFFLDVFGTFFIKKKSTRAFGAYEPRQGMSEGQTNSQKVLRPATDVKSAHVSMTFIEKY